MNKVRPLQLVILGSAITLQYLQAPVSAGQCTFNGRPKECQPNQGHRIQLTKGSDLDIKWADGEVTTIKFLSPNNRALRGGDQVLINGKIEGKVTYNRDVRMGVFEIGIQSSSGNRFSVQLGD